MSADFVLDRFQVDAVAAIDDDHSVLVAAPTGAGKTLIAEHAVEVVLAGAGRVFYTTPIKALSNQKYGDLVRRHGTDAVGLLTGDNVINADAPVVVMTTEVLRNMLYASKPLDDLRFVILDEVHYLQDAYRGPVWEEVIIHLPEHVRLVCLSATVSNADELADWLTTVRGPTDVIVEHRRPVELEHRYAVTDKHEGRVRVLPTLVSGRPNPDGASFDAEPRGRQGRQKRRWATPWRVEVIDALAGEELLPAIVFVFSRAGCDEAVRASLAAGLDLTSAQDKRAIAAIVDRHVEGLSEDDLAALAFSRWKVGVEAGIAAHHAGMVPPFKEAVEECFAEGLVKVVFATETLALGINMPARAVVIENLSKFTGETHELLTPGQYAQITGRAGRRGIDDEGTAIVLWSRFVTFDKVAALAASREFALLSSFRPTYNMAVNLARRTDPEGARHLLALSFAQFQADRSVVDVERRLQDRRNDLAAAEQAMTCDRGDIDEYRRLVDGARGAAAPRGVIERSLAGLRPGDVIDIPHGDGDIRVVVLTVAQRKGGAVRMKALTGQAKLVSLGATDFDHPVAVRATIETPEPFVPGDGDFRSEMARRMRDEPGSPRAVRTDGASSPVPSVHPDDHPVAQCPDLDRHLKAAKKVRRLRRRIAATEQDAQGRTDTLARQFDRVVQVLESHDFIRDWSLTADGERLAGIFHESDLLIAATLGAGHFDDLDAPSLAALASCFSYEHRSPDPPPPPWFPSEELRQRWKAVAALTDELTAEEAALGLRPTRRPEAGFVPLAFSWTRGDDLDHVLDEDLSGGDFVRNIRQLMDLLRQIALITPSPVTAAVAHDALARIDRGLIAASSRIGAP